MFGAAGNHPAPGYVGLTAAEARERASRAGVTSLRVADPDRARVDGGPSEVWTADLRRDRLNLRVSGGVVDAAEWF